MDKTYYRAVNCASSCIEVKGVNFGSEIWSYFGVALTIMCFRQLRTMGNITPTRPKFEFEKAKIYRRYVAFPIPTHACHIYATILAI